MKIAVIGGIRLLLNPFFLVMLAILAFFGLLAHMLLIFSLVMLHEIGHILAARSFGLTVREVEFLPFGGVARIDDLLEADPFVEGAVALAGPLTSFFLAGLTYYLMQTEALPMTWLQTALRTNLAIGLINLVPALPLDGGRLYRSCLVRNLGYRAATAQVARLGKFLAIVIGLLGLADFWLQGRYPGLVVVAFFLYLGANKEQGMAIYVLLKSLARKKQELKEKGVIQAQQLVADDSTALKDVVKHFTPQKYNILIVMDNKGQLLGMVSETEVLDSLLETSVDTPLSTILKNRL